MVADLDHNKRLYKDAVEENGRLEARIQAFAINAQSEQDVLSGEVKRREETIARLKMEAMNLNEVNSRCEEKVCFSWISSTGQTATTYMLHVVTCQWGWVSIKTTQLNADTSRETLDRGWTSLSTNLPG